MFSVRWETRRRQNYKCFWGADPAEVHVAEADGEVRAAGAAPEDSQVDRDELISRLDSMFNPEQDDEFMREWPDSRLEQHHGLNFDYMKSYDWEGSTMHPSTRHFSGNEPDVVALTRNMDVSTRLFDAALRLFGDSLIEYHNAKENPSALRFYPPIIVTFWSAFESFVRYTSELMLLTSKGIPEGIARYLREQAVEVDRRGDLKLSDRHRGVLDRYAVLLRYGFGLQVDRGATYWQGLQKAQELRDYYTHIEAVKSRSISSAEVFDFMEAVLLGIITPSSQAKKTLMLNVFYLYDRWADLGELTKEALPKGHTEQPFFHSWSMEGNFLFYCPFVAVDTDRFPNSDEERERRKN